jgi:hypothetical protein
MRNNRIGEMDFLNQHCALASDLESMLLARVYKIVLQQNLPQADLTGGWHSRRTCHAASTEAFPKSQHLLEGTRAFLDLVARIEQTAGHARAGEGDGAARASGLCCAQLRCNLA